MHNQFLHTFKALVFLSAMAALAGCSQDGAGDAAVGSDTSSAQAELHGNVIARVGDQEITFHELNTLLNSSAVVGLSIPALGTPERDTVRIAVLDKFISSNLLYLDAIKQGVDKDPGYQRDVERFSDAMLAGMYWDRQLAGDVAVTEEQIQAMFRQKAGPEDVLSDDTRNLITVTLRRAQRQARMAEAQQRLREGVTWKIHEQNLAIKDDEQRADGVVLAEVGDKTITWGQVKDKIIRAGKGAVIADVMAMEDDARLAQLEREIDLRILVNRARAAGLEQDPLYQRRFSEYRKSRLINVHRDRLLAAIEPDEATLRGHYTLNRAQFVLPEARKLQMVVVGTEQEAADLKQRIKAGDLTMFQAARDHSIAAGAGQNLGEVGWVNQGDLAPALDEAVYALEPAEIGGPVESPAGWHLVLVQDVKDAVYTDFDEVSTRKLVRRRYLDEKLDDYTVALRKNGFTVEVYQDNLVRLAQQEADMVGDLVAKAQQPGSVTEQRLEELQKYVQPGAAK